MAANTNPIFGKIAAPGTPATIVPADTTTSKTIITADATNGSILTGISVTSDDSAARNLGLYIGLGGVDYLVGTIAVPALSGTDGATPAVNLLSLGSIPGLNPDGSLALPPGAIVRVASTATITAAKKITIVPFALDY